MIFLVYLLPILALFLYSYGYLDYNLTLSSHPMFMRFVDFFQDIVFFDRPLSTRIYIILLCMTTFAYLLTIFYHRNHKNFPWKPVVIIGLVATFAYPMMTHDVFNYLFHARVVITHHANPHLVAPQVFVGDEWLRFMHWVHSPSAYGYGFTAYMIIPYVLGLGKLVPSLYLYKLMSFFWYLLAVWLVGKITARTKTIAASTAQLLFALNPIIIMEWLINAHNESMMVTLMLLSWYLVGHKKLLSGTLALTIGALAKYAAVLLIPGLLMSRIFGEQRALYLTSLILLLAPFFYHYNSQYQIWYITWALPFVVLTGNRYLIAATLGYSLGGLLTYVPYIATGFWSLTPSDRSLYFIVPTLVALLISVVVRKLRL